MDNVQFCFEGTMKVTCNRCHKSHEIVFDGDEQSTLDYAIEEALTTAGWDSKRIICPDCFDPLEEPVGGDIDEENEDEYYYDDILFSNEEDDE